MISIIVPVFNQHDMTEECLSTILECTQDCELIVIDNGSDPPIHTPFSGFIETTLIRNEENKGFPAAVNQGIRAAKGDIVCLLNNDVIVTPGWADRLIAALEEFSIVGPVTNYAAGMQKVQIDSYSSKDEMNDAAHRWAEHCGNDVQEVNFIIGYCMVFRKSLFDDIGDFDESLWPCSGEEVDFCFRAREKGHRVGIVTGCYVHHEGSRTFVDLEKAGELTYSEVCKRNDDHLAEKWGKNYWARQSISSSPEPDGLCLNLGCGYRHIEGFVNIDNRPEVNPDLVCDVIPIVLPCGVNEFTQDGGLPYGDNSVDMVRAYDFLEHIPIGKVIPVMDEIWRVLKPGAVFESLTPSTDGRGAFMDPTHVSFWNQASWLYYSDPEYRALYGIKAHFDIESIEDRATNEAMGIIHTHVIARAVK